MAYKEVTLLEYALAFAIRLLLVKSEFQIAIQDRVEIATPLNSWKKLLEGIHLYEAGVDPYSGDLFHETPLTLLLFQSMISYLGPWLKIVFIILDLCTAYLLFKTAAIYMQTLKQQEDKIKVYKGTEKLASVKISNINMKEAPVLVAYAYLFNPYNVLNCAAQTTTGISNLLLAAHLNALVNGRKYLCVLCLSLATLQSWYPVILLVPTCINFWNAEQSKTTIAAILGSFVAMTAGLLWWCQSITGNWLFLDSIYFFILNVQELTPNIGLFWYFFTEMFEHFRALFVASLQINATILYLVPLSLHLKNEPVFLTVILIALTAVFKSYPSLGDVGFYLSLLPLWSHLFLFMQQLFVVGCLLIMTSVLGPTVWHLWIYSGSANANFFFGVTLAFATAQIFLITDLLFAHKKREFALKHGWFEDSTKQVLILD